MIRLSKIACVLLLAGGHAEWHAGSEPASAAPAETGGEAAPAADAAAATTAPEGPRVVVVQPAAAPAAETAAPQPAAESTAPAATGTVDVACQFSDGWIAVVPRRVYRPNEDGLMQALIGFATDPNTWAGQADWQRYSNFPAHQCGVDALHLQLQPGSYVVLVAKASQTGAATPAPAEAEAEGEGDEGPEEEVAAQPARNGRIERISVRLNQTVSRSFTVQMMNHAWTGI
jgi:hypothetical protein